MYTEKTITDAFNEWMRRYIDEPERYQREFQSVVEFLAEDNNGLEPSYGQYCYAYLTELILTELIKD